MPTDVLLAQLDEDQRAAATAFGGPIAIISGPGSGKTRTITARIAYGCLTGELSPDACLALTFTTRAAGQLRTRLRELDAPAVAARTIHSAALRQLRHFWPYLDGTQVPRVIADSRILIRDSAAALGIALSGRQLSDAVTHIGWAKSHLIQPHNFETEFGLRRPGVAVTATTARVYEQYELLKAREQAMDFEDVLVYLSALFEEFPDALTQVRRQYRHLTVDEFQDLTPLQFRLVRQWAGPRPDLCVVGDPGQAIYGFAGATAAFLRNFEQQFPRARTFNLSRNYRCAPVIAQFAASIGRSINGATAHRAAMVSSGDAQQGISRELVDSKSIHMHETPDLTSEMQQVADRIQQLLSATTRAEDVAVLVRTHEQVRVVARELRAADIAVVERNATDLFERPEIRTALHRLRTMALMEGEVRALVAVEQIAGDLGWAETHVAAANADIWDSFARLVNLARQLDRDEAPMWVSDFIYELEKRAESVDMPASPAISVLTMHAAKGLEWDVVFLLDASARHTRTPALESVSHVWRDESDDQVSTEAEGRKRDQTARQDATAIARELHIAEELCLLHVATSRAREQLFISWSRAAGGRSPLLPL